jgi:hypothetical protein
MKERGVASKSVFESSLYGASSGLPTSAKNLVYAGEVPSGLIVFALLLGAVVIVFWQQLIGAGVFIGESDRLNAYLNMRLAEYDALQKYGRVPAWNPTMFGGFSVAALHWMNPGADPIAYFLQLFPRDRVYQVLGYVSIALVPAACTTAYFYIRDLTGARIPAAIAALCYGLSVFGIHRIAQIDNIYLVLLLLPAAMLAIRRVRTENLIRPFVGLAMSMTALAFWAFLQEVAYAFCFLGAYALYRAAVYWKSGPRAALAILIVFGTSSVVALLFAAPRIVALSSEFFQLTRTSSLQYSGYQELLRFFHEGIYGRYFAEGPPEGTSLNIHEGLQLLSSTTVVLFVCFGLLRPSRRLELGVSVLLFAMIFAIVPIYLVPASAGWPSQALGNVALYACIAGAIVLLLRLARRHSSFGTALQRLVPPTPYPADKAFHSVALVLILFLILVPEGYYGVYLLFGRVDFTHSRLSLLAILPLCSLFAVYLSELKSLPLEPAVKRDGTLHPVAAALGLIIAAAAVSWLIHGPLIDQLVPKTAFQIRPYGASGNIMPPVAVKALLAVLVLAAVLAAFLCRPYRTLDGRVAATIVVATFALVETVTYAHFKVNGPQNWTYPVPFGSLSYMDVPPSVLRPPSEEKLKAFADKLEVDDFRSVLLTSRSLYEGNITPHISQFWRARMVGGLGPGVPKRLAALPWPDGGLGGHRIELRRMSHVNPDLLSLLNVKYLIVTTPDLYFNTASKNPDQLLLTLVASRAEVVNIAGISLGLIKNPVAPLPRHFLVEKVTGVREAPRVREGALEAPARPASDRPDSAFALARGRIDQLTSHSLAEDFRGTEIFDASGPLDVAYHDDVIDIRIIPSSRDRFVVIDERYHPNWRARTQTQDIPIFPTNAVMMGVRIPASLDRIELRFEPFFSTRAAHMLMSLAVLIFLAATGAFWLAQRHVRHAMLRGSATGRQAAVSIYGSADPALGQRRYQ